jgi:LytS/YehU family sensor histidine kinase
VLGLRLGAVVGWEDGRAVTGATVGSCKQYFRHILDQNILMHTIVFAILTFDGTKVGLELGGSVGEAEGVSVGLEVIGEAVGLLVGILVGAL